jgi:hypothetical protein
MKGLDVHGFALPTYLREFIEGSFGGYHSQSQKGQQQGQLDSDHAIDEKE